MFLRKLSICAACSEVAPPASCAAFCMSARALRSLVSDCRNSSFAFRNLTILLSASSVFAWTFKRTSRSVVSAIVVSVG